MAHEAGKGSKRRLKSISQEEYESRWDAIFGKDLKDDSENKNWDHYSDLPNPEAYKNDAGVLLGEDSAFQADEVGSNPITRSTN